MAQVSSKSESRRVAAVRALNLLDTPAEDRFDRIARLAQRTFGVPIVVISLIDEDRVWFKSRLGLSETQMPRNGSFCDETIVGDVVLIVPNAEKDERFASHPLVAGGPKIRFYAGQPLAGPDGSIVGTLSLLDTSPRDLDNEQRRALRDLAEMAEEQLASSGDRLAEPPDEHARLLARMRMSPEHMSARARIRGLFLAITLVMFATTGLTLRIAGKLVSDADSLAAGPAIAAEHAPAIARLSENARFFRTGIGVRALIALILLTLILVIFDRQMDSRLSSLAAVELDHARLRSVLFAITDGVVVADARGKFTVFNPAAERILGLGLMNDPAGSARFYSSFFREDGAPCVPEKHPLALAVAGESTHASRLLVRNERRPGGVPVLVTAAPVQGTDGAPAGGVILFRDVI